MKIKYEVVIDIGFVGHRTLLWSFRPSFPWLGATASVAREIA